MIKSLETSVAYVQQLWLASVYVFWFHPYIYLIWFLVRYFSMTRTGRYVAPEVFGNEEYDTTVDVFSFALILQEVRLSFGRKCSTSATAFLLLLGFLQPFFSSMFLFPRWHLIANVYSRHVIVYYIFMRNIFFLTLLNFIVYDIYIYQMYVLVLML